MLQLYLVYLDYNPDPLVNQNELSIKKLESHSKELSNRLMKIPFQSQP